MNNKYIIWISVIAWFLSIIVAFVTQGNDIANVVVLVISFWLMFLGWWLNRQRGRL